MLKKRKEGSFESVSTQEEELKSLTLIKRKKKKKNVSAFFVFFFGLCSKIHLKFFSSEISGVTKKNEKRVKSRKPKHKPAL